MLFPKDFPEKLRSEILVSEVVSKRVKLKARGPEFQGLCPFHNEKSPSFTVNDQKGFYHCFGCAAHGDIFSFLMNTEGLDYRDAVIKLAGDFGIEVPRVNVDQATYDRTEKSYLILEKITQFFEKNLYNQNGLEARNYLKKRGLNSVIAKKFRLGFSQDSYEALTKFLKSENFTDDDLSKTGAINSGGKNGLYDKFRNRVIFPITDKKNRVIAYGGRTLGDDMPKYLNSSETDLFKKGQVLYNFFLARKPIFDKGYAVMVEGYMDTIALVAGGIENVVAGLGTAVTIDHLKNLFQITDKIIICLDGDNAGIQAAKRICDLALPVITSKKNIYFTFLPDRMDPDDYIKNFGAKELEREFQQAKPLSEALFEFALADLEIASQKKISAESKAKIEALLSSKIAVISDPHLKKYFSLFFKELLFSYGKALGKGSSLATATKIRKKIKSNLADTLAQQIIALIIMSPQLVNVCEEGIDPRDLQFASERLTDLKELVISIIDENPAILPDSLLAELREKNFDNELTAIKNSFTVFKHDSDLNLARFRILLLKELLLQVNQQYKDSLSKIEEISTHESAVTNQRIKEIFDYKQSLEQKIVLIEKEII